MIKLFKRYIGHLVRPYEIDSQKTYLNAEIKALIDFLVVYILGFMISIYIFNMELSVAQSIGVAIVPITILVARWIFWLNPAREKHFHF